MGSIVSHIVDKIKEYGSLEAFEAHNDYIAGRKSRLDYENAIWGTERPHPRTGDLCVVYSEDKYWNCVVEHVSKSGKTFWAVDDENKIFFKNVPVGTFKIGHLPQA